MFLEYTKSICPVCKAVVDAEVNVRDNKVFLRKRCREHGRFEALVYSDAEAYAASMRFNKPGTLPLQTQTEVHDGCPLDCGLCPDHKQHACVGLIEVNTACNLACPACFADSGHHPDGFSLTLEQVEAGLDALVAAEGDPEVVMFSGGEPSIHPQILEFCAIARAKGVRSVVLNTNGIRLAHDPSFALALAQLDVRIYLQFDGLDASTHLAFRGRDLRQAKAKALDRCAAAGLGVLLVAAVDADVNLEKVGDIVRHGIAHPAVRGVVFQPVTHAGRTPTFDPLQRLTNPDVIRALVEQCGDWFRPSDFFPVPCCFPTCRSVTYLLADEEDVVPIPRLLPMDTYLDYVSNRALPDPSVRTALEGLWSASAIPGSEDMVERLTTALGSLGLTGDLNAVTAAALESCAACGIDFPAALAGLASKAFMIVIQDFQDPYTLNVKQLMKCCVEEITPDGRLIPFCAYNSVGYREQVREQLSGAPVPAVVPNAAELADLLVPSRHGSRTVDPHAGSTVGAVQVNLGRKLR
ncbi:MAG: radical SAM protein [Acidimicrobiia bacterium]|nr:radical SAM protein [Acidimicrobiia bacterium]